MEDMSLSAVPFCFMAGTNIMTPVGQVPVETLRRGDLVETIDGRQMPIGWIGRQTVSSLFSDHLKALPIRIKAGALAEGIPSRDLLISPAHAIFFDGVLVQACALVNGSSIIREYRVPKTFIYYHMELADHSLVLAENVASETFVDNSDLYSFDNWQEYVQLYPEGRQVEEMPFPRAKSHRQVPQSIRKKLAERAVIIGDGSILTAA